MILLRRFLWLLWVLPLTVQASDLIRVDYVLVKKAERKLYLMQSGRPVREFPISLGLVPTGHKLHEGDMRTPEGMYTLDWRNADSKFYKSIHISYPSPDDLARAQAVGKPAGGMIMLHGLPRDSKLDIQVYRGWDWTQGCIALSNQDMDEIWGLVPDGTPILIQP